MTSQLREYIRQERSKIMRRIWWADQHMVHPYTPKEVSK